MRLFSALLFAMSLTVAVPEVRAQSASDGAAFADGLAALNTKGFDDKAAAINALAGLGDPRAVDVLQAMSEGLLFYRKEDGLVVVAKEAGRRQYDITDPVSAENLGVVSSRDLRKISANNRLRQLIRGVLGQFALLDEDVDRRIAAALDLMKSPSAEAIPLVSAALTQEEDPAAQKVFQTTLSVLELRADDPATRLQAVEQLASFVDPTLKTHLERLLLHNGDGFVEPDEGIRNAAAVAIERIDRRIAYLTVIENLVFGISLGSVLLLAAIGLAITFGVMGVINMAHGEMIMIGAYSAFVVQQAFRQFLPPELFGFYVVAAVPAAFLLAGTVGLIIERGCIRFLYGRPLETLLATWGISLILQQAVRSLFGANNREVANPAWLAGSIEITSGLTFTVNRLYIIAFSLIVVALLAALMRYSRFGLNMRAVTQNRSMAASMGIATGRVDALTFGLGSGIAGIGGVALSQISNVSPNLGQSFIVDSFMVVVFGGVGSLWGTIVGAFSLGIVNKFLEPFSGAILGKIIVLIAIILFIQKRPRGLFALRGRAAEA